MIAAGIALLALLAGLGWMLFDHRSGESPTAVQEKERVAGGIEMSPLPDLAGETLQVGCRQGECAWLRVVRVETAAATPRGELRRLVGRGGTSRYDDEPPEAYDPSVAVSWETRDESSFAFCSAEGPAYAFADEGDGLILHYLDLFDLGGYQLASARMYMRLCHDSAFDSENPQALRALGYRPGTRSEQVENAAAEDLTRF